MAQLTYPEVGATRTTLPTGYNHLRSRTEIGTGRDVLEAAGAALMHWRMHAALHVRPRASAPRAEPGVQVTLTLGVGPLRITAPCEIVWTTVDSRSIGFAYGTLSGHPECGEEAFVVDQDHDGTVWLTVTAFSKPALWYTRTAGPLVPAFQRRYARACGTALRRLANA